MFSVNHSDSQEFLSQDAKKKTFKRRDAVCEVREKVRGFESAFICVHHMILLSHGSQRSR